MHIFLSGRFPLSVGIAGHVATTQEVINIASAYKDARFNKWDICLSE